MTANGCASHDRFTAGCAGCQEQARAYDRKRRAAIRNGTWKPSVPAARVQAHIDALVAGGANLRGIATAARLPHRTVQGVKTRTYVQGETAAAILAVRSVPAQPPAGMVPVVGATRRVRALAAIGWSLGEQANQAGMYLQQVWQVAWAKNPTITLTTDRTFRDLFERLSATPGPSTRARNHALRKGWVPPLAWDDNMDDPAATPDLGNDDRGVVDEVAVRRALAGERVRLTRPERVAALQTGLAQGRPLAAVAATLHLSYATACDLVGVEPERHLRTAQIDAEVQRLSAAGHDQYTISALTGVHRRTVGRSLGRITTRQEQRIAS